VKIKAIEVLHCDAGWRPWSFIKVTRDDGLLGWSECTDSHGSPKGVEAVARDLSKLLVGQDLGSIRKASWDMYKATRQSPGSIVQKAISGIENALLDLKAKSLGVPVSDLLGGAVRDEILVYWSHCGTTRARSFDAVGRKPLLSLADVAELGKEVVSRGFKALKTNIVIPGQPPSVFMPGFGGGFNATDPASLSRVLRAIESLMGTFRDAVGNEVDICLDLNFNFKPDTIVSIAKVLEPYRLLWLEMDCFYPQALRTVREKILTPVCSGENLYGTRDYLPFFSERAMDVAACDVIWNGLSQSTRIADMAEVHEMDVAPHNHYSHLATMISAHFCACVPNARILEVDIDDVPWKDDLVTSVPTIEKSYLQIPKTPGWGVEVNEEAIRSHPWSKF
jgi:galactonate dehydratase